MRTPTTISEGWCFAPSIAIEFASYHLLHLIGLSDLGFTEQLELLDLQVFRGFVYTTHSSNAFPNWSFFKSCAHVHGRKDIVILITVSSYGTFHWAQDPVAYVLTRLRF